MENFIFCAVEIKIIGIFKGQVCFSNSYYGIKPEEAKLMCLLGSRTVLRWTFPDRQFLDE